MVADPALNPLYCGPWRCPLSSGQRIPEKQIHMTSNPDEFCR
ncbi:hypothetical protein GWL_20600 [Herbaspirillum sp. GW103]|nr:hypothetical protein GWL_20600 [Herbaspirillum sp. GW103]